MYDYKKSRGRLLTASSLALAAILTMGAGTGWAATGNSTAVDDPNIVGDFSDVAPSAGVVDLTAAAADGEIKTQALKLAAGTTEVVLNGSTFTGTGNSSGLVVDADGKTVATVTIADNQNLTLGVLVADPKNTEGLNSTQQGGSLFNVVLGQNTSAGGALNVVSGGYSITNLSLNGGDLVTDPDWAFGQLSYLQSTIAKLAVGYIGAIPVSGVPANADIAIDGGIVVGRNSHLTIGIEDEGAFAESAILALQRNSGSLAPIAWAQNGGMTAALAITKQVNIDPALNASIEVDGTKVVGAAPTKDGSVVFAENSLLIIDNASVGTAGNAAIDGGGNTIDFTIDNTQSSLYIANAKVDGANNRGQTVVYEGFDGTNSPNGFTDVYYDTRLIRNVEQNWAAGNSLVVTNEYVGAASGKVVDPITGEITGGYADGKITSSTASTIDAVYLGGVNDTMSADGGVRFVSRITNDRFLDANRNSDTKVVTTFDGAASMASLAGVQTGSFSISNTVAGQYNSRLSYLRDTAPAAGSEPGSVAVWINPFYNFLDVDGVSIGRHNAEYEINYGGATIGADTNINENFRLGLAVSVGGGDTESKGSKFNKTESDLDFWGIGVYGSYTNGMFGLTGDLGYTGASYDIDQRQDVMNKFTADVDTKAFTIGLNGEYRFMTENCLNIIPHVGIRYTNLKTDSYRVKERGSKDTIFRVNSDKQNIWTFPVGVTFTGDVDTNSGWVIKPMADLGVIFAAGDLDADSKYRLGDTNIRGKVVSDDVVDAVTFNGLVGLKADAGNGFSVGLDYNLKASDNLTSHGVTGMIRYEF